MLCPPFRSADFEQLTIADEDGNPTGLFRLSLVTFGKHIPIKSQFKLGFFRIEIDGREAIVYGSEAWFQNQRSAMNYERDIVSCKPAQVDYYVGEDAPILKTRRNAIKGAVSYWYDTLHNDVREAQEPTRRGQDTIWTIPLEGIVRLELNPETKTLTHALLSPNELQWYTRDPAVRLTLPVASELAEPVSYDDFIASLEASVGEPLKKPRR